MYDRENALAKMKALELLNTSRLIAEMAKDLIEKHSLHDLDFDISLSSGVNQITWYNSSESC